MSPLVPADQEGIRLEPFDSAVAWSYLEVGIHSIIHGSAHTAHLGRTPSFCLSEKQSPPLSPDPHPSSPYQKQQNSCALKLKWAFKVLFLLALF